MSETRHEVEVQFTAKDLTSSVIGKINKSAGVLSNRVDKITGTVAGFAKTFGGLGAIFGFAGSAAGAKRYLDTIEDLSTITGQSANKMAGMQHAMEQSGLAGEETRAILIAISQKQMEIAAGSEELVKSSKRYGLNLKKGPEEALVSMAKAIEKGKMGTAEVVQLLSETGAKSMDLLRKGPAEVQRLLTEGSKKNSHINATSIAQYKQMDVQMKKVKQAWTRITTTVMLKLAPALTKLMGYVERNIDSWSDSANRFGDFLAEHMDSAISSARVFGKIMMTNYAFMKLTGDGMLANVGKMAKFAKGKKGAGAADAAGSGATDALLAASMLPGGKKGGTISGRKGAAAKAAKGPGKIANAFLKKFPKISLDMLLLFKNMGGITKKIGSVFAKLGKYTGKFGKIFSVIARVGKAIVPLLKIAKMAARFTVIGVVITAVVAGITLILKNVGGVRDRIVGMLGDIWTNIKSIGETIGGLFGPGSFLREFFTFLGKGFVGVIEGILWLVKKITRGIAIAAVMATEQVGVTRAKQILSLREDKRLKQEYKKAFDIQQKLIAAHAAGTKTTAKHVAMFNTMVEAYAESNQYFAKGQGVGGVKKQLSEFEKRFGKVAETPGGRPQNNYDFRNSRFDIMQNFAEGFDPDRIAVAFANDLSTLGERRLQSGLAPAFSAR